MRAGWLAGAVLLALLPATPAAAHPGHGYENVTVQADAQAYDPATVRVVVNQGVLWSWDPGIVFADHSVTVDPGEGEEFASGTKTSGTYLHVFRKAGTYAYHCTVYPWMTGSVEVVPLPGKPPKLKRLRVRSGERPVARFRASKAGDLVARIASRSGGEWRTEKSFSRHASKGRNKLKLRMGRLEPGRYRLALALYDLRGRRDGAKDRFRLKP